MATNDYHFITKWHFDAPIERVYDLISNPLDYPRWWPEVYLDARELEAGDANGLGRLVKLRSKGWLLYNLRWQARTIEVQRPIRLTLDATGDFTGRGIWTLFQESPAPTDVVFDWKLRADKALLRYLSLLLKPAFSASHRWAMEQGERNLRRELGLPPTV